MYEVDEAARLISQSADPGANIIFGATIDEAMKDQMKVTVVATGFSMGAVRSPRVLDKKKEEKREGGEEGDEFDSPAFLRQNDLDS
jgi:cell division protein FtsZ